MTADVSPLETVLEAVLVRYGVLVTTRFANGGDRGDLASDLADAVRDLLGKGHQAVVSNDGGWMVEHSLDCRLSGRMAECEFSSYMAGWREPPVPAGRYQMSWNEDGDDVVFEREEL